MSIPGAGLSHLPSLWEELNLGLLCLRSEIRLGRSLHRLRRSGDGEEDVVETWWTG